MATESSEGTVEQLRLRERLARLRELPLLRGVGVSGEMARLQHQIERIDEDEGRVSKRSLNLASGAARKD